ncbi:MAG: hypothetical protein KBD07_02395 [Candidatus Omnitrophica bacterium]|nr:hypothetical protein [Candidatus Omnitrophota bacterium]
MKLHWAAAALIAASVLTQTSSVPGTEQADPLHLAVAPLMVRLSEGQLLSPESRIELRSVDPKGNLHTVTDLHGQGQWSLETMRDGRSFQIIPSPTSYAGPLQVRVDGRIVSRFGEMASSSQTLVLEKVLSARMADGTILKVHYTDFALDQSEDWSYPRRVFTHMKAAYEVLGRDLRLDDNRSAKPRAIEAYIGDTEAGGILPFGGFTLEDFKRAPLFMVRTDERSGAKVPVLLLPANYSKFLEFWNRINRIPGESAYSTDQYLASSIMHEMTHAIVHGFNENLGSTEHEIRGGDWYTEGLARYFECKTGSDAGFASEGFRKIVDGRVQFSRGGANYYLRYPDESFFTMRYENALFWMYLDKRMGSDAIVQITRDLKGLAFNASAADYARVLSEVTGESFETLLNDYFNWVYRGDYTRYREGSKLLPVAAAKSVWSKGQFYVYNNRGSLVQLAGSSLTSDWVSGWGNDTAQKTTEIIAGDWTLGADIKPLAFDAHEIMISAAAGEARELSVENTGGSKRMRVTAYFESAQGTRTATADATSSGSARFTIGPNEKITRAGLAIVNLDLEQTASYRINIS